MSQTPVKVARREWATARFLAGGNLPRVLSMCSLRLRISWPVFAFRCACSLNCYHAEFTFERLDLVRKGAVATKLLQFTDFNRLHPLKLPIVLVRRGSEGTELSHAEAYCRDAPTQIVCGWPISHSRREGPRPRSLPQTWGPAVVSGPPCLVRPRTSQRESEWRACDEGLHNWTGREDL